MKLEFNILVVDDNPDGIKQSVQFLKEHLERSGFMLNRHDAPVLSKSGLKRLARSQGKNFDLVMVDYKLGSSNIDGASAAKELRRNLLYTDMIFYSSLPEKDLLDELAKLYVPGVFVARRDDLNNALSNLADTVIRKAVDLNHMRGIAMAEVAEMDVLMEETLKSFFQSDDAQVIKAGQRTIKKLRGGIKDSLDLLDTTCVPKGLSDMVSNGPLFSFTKKYEAIRRAVKCLPEKPSEAINVLESYQNEIIDKRNMLAHVKETYTKDGEIILCSIKGDQREIIDDDWMSTFRRHLRKHKTALTFVCKAINDNFGTTESSRDSEEHQP